MVNTRRTAAKFIFDNSLLLLVGTAAAVVWANLDLASYEHVAHPLHFAVNDVGMVFFFALAAKEVFEATLPGGPLASPSRELLAVRDRPRRAVLGCAVLRRIPSGSRARTYRSVHASQFA